MKNLTWQNPEQLFVAQVLINKVKSKCCGIKGYYYAPFIEQFKENLDPIMKMGAKILQEIDSILDSPTLDKDTRDRYQSEHEKLMLDYDYLF